MKYLKVGTIFKNRLLTKIFPLFFFNIFTKSRVEKIIPQFSGEFGCQHWRLKEVSTFKLQFCC